jgi:hypothetical protein
MRNLLGALMALMIGFYACQKEDQSLGLNLLPGVKVIETRSYKDSSLIKAYTFTDDSFRIDHDNLLDPYSRLTLLGSFNDPVMGYTNAAFAAQFRLPYNPRYENKLYPEEGPAVLDSLVLRMSYKYVYGDTITPQRILVHEMVDSLRFDAAYLPSYKLRNHINPTVLGSLDFVPKFRPTSTDTTAQTLRVPLSAEFGNRLLHMDSLNYQSNTKFLNAFKGLFIETAPLSRKGALVRLESSLNYLVLYYHNSKNDTLAYAYNLTSNSASVSEYIHDYRGTAFYAHLNQQAGNDTLVYLQPTGGTKVKINVPNLSKWKDSTNYIINKATLSIRVDTVMSDFKRYEMPAQIYMKYYGYAKTDTFQTQGLHELFPEDANLSVSYYGGVYNASTGSYDFNITQHLQKVISGLKNGDVFYLVTTQRNNSPKRVVLKSGSSSKPIVLNVIYTKYKQ